MNGRSIPWRKKPTQDIKETFESAAQLKLYLLQELGPTLFIFKDEAENKLKVSIGQEISCTCSPNKKDHCIHTLYVFIKIYKISQENPLIWQGSYIDSEIADLIRNRYNPQGNQKPKKVEKFLKKSSTGPQPGKGSAGNHRQSFHEDDVCPICHEDMKEEEGVTYCKKACGNNFHIKCILIWAEHSHRIGDPISCPMCRCDWGGKAYDGLLRELQDFEARLILHKGHKCGSCKTGKQNFIKGKLYHCVTCENYDLCEKCYQSFEHFEHHRYLMKENVKDTWKPAPNRDRMLMNAQQKSSLDVFNEIIGHSRPGINGSIIPMPSSNFAGFNRLGGNLYEGEISMDNFLLSCFQDQNSGLEIAYGKANSLAIVGHDVKKNCSSCRTDRADISGLKRLACGHVMHGHCILEMVSNKNFKCPDDGLEFLRGYRSAWYAPEVPTPSATQNKHVEKPSHNLKKDSKKPFEEQKSAKNVKLRPLELDIKGKAFAVSNDGTESTSNQEVLDSLFIQKPKPLNPRGPTKQPPQHPKPKLKPDNNTTSLPPLFEIQGTNFSAEQAPSKNMNVSTKKPLMPIQDNSINITSNRANISNVNNFRIVSKGIKVMPKKTRKSNNPASLNVMTNEEDMNIPVQITYGNEIERPFSRSSLRNESVGSNDTDFENINNY